MHNPSLRQEARYEPASVIPIKQKSSIIEWLQNTNRLIPRDRDEREASIVDEDVELSELMDVDDIGYEDEGDSEIEAEED